MATLPRTNRPVSSGLVSRAVLAVVLAFGFWAWVTNQNDPDRERDFPNIPVTLINQPDGLAVTDFSPANVTVSIWGPRSIVASQNLAAGNFSATVDLKDARPGAQQLPIHIQTTTQGLRKREANPSTANVTIERSIAKTMTVTVPMPAQQGIKLNNLTATPSEVQVSGPESRVNTVAQIAAAIDLGDRTSSFQTVVEVKAYDANNKEVSGVTISPRLVTVAADITDLRNERVVPVVTPDVTGAAAPGFRLDTITVNPNQVTLAGDPQAIRNVANVPTQPISIDGLNQNKTFTVPLDTSKLPAGVTIKDNVRTVQVQVAIVEITQDIAYQVRVQTVNLRPGLQVSLSPQDVTVTLRGTRQQLDQINGTNIVAIANLATFTGAGTGPVTIDVQLPTGSPVKVVKVDPPAITATVVVPPTPTPVPSPTPRPTPVPTATPTA